MGINDDLRLGRSNLPLYRRATAAADSQTEANREEKTDFHDRDSVLTLVGRSMHSSHRIVEQGVFSSRRQARNDFAVPTRNSCRRARFPAKASAGKGGRSVKTRVKRRISLAPHRKWRISFFCRVPHTVFRITEFFVSFC